MSSGDRAWHRTRDLAIALDPRAPGGDAGKEPLVGLVFVPRIVAAELLGLLVEIERRLESDRQDGQLARVVSAALTHALSPTDELTRLAVLRGRARWHLLVGAPPLPAEIARLTEDPLSDPHP